MVASIKRNKRSYNSVGGKMAQYVKLIKKEVIADNTMAFYWEKPTDFEFIAGQFCEITLLNPLTTDEEGNTRAFSFVYTPYEKNLVTATRIRDTAFKQNLQDLPIGTEVKLTGPYGDFKLHKNQDKAAVFIIGGIGITPVRSIIATATHDKLLHKITLIYSNRTPADAPFISDFEDFSQDNPNFTFVPVYTKVSETEWNGESGHINTEMLKKYIPDISKPIYYLSGPAKMVKAMRQLLVEVGADEDNIRSEEFDGYEDT
jgi:ferredoxin-NADP reductase